MQNNYNMEDDKMTKQEKLDKIKKLADKHLEMKKVITKMLDELDLIQLEYNRLVKEVKKK